jgi:hypothetical protein
MPFRLSKYRAEVPMRRQVWDIFESPQWKVAAVRGQASLREGHTWWRRLRAEQLPHCCWKSFPSHLAGQSEVGLSTQLNSYRKFLLSLFFFFAIPRFEFCTCKAGSLPLEPCHHPIRNSYSSHCYLHSCWGKESTDRTGCPQGGLFFHVALLPTLDEWYQV